MIALGGTKADTEYQGKPQAGSQRLEIGNPGKKVSFLKSQGCIRHQKELFQIFFGRL